MPKLILSFKGRRLSEHRLEQGRHAVGRDPDCRVHIDSLAVAPRHLEIRVEGERYRITALEPDNPVFLNGEPIESADLDPGDTIRLGKHTLVLDTREPPLQPAPAPDPVSDQLDATNPFADIAVPAHHPAYLQILSGEQMGRVIPLNRSIVRLGKAGGDCAMISLRTGGEHYLSSLEGAEPVVNDVPIGNESIRLTPGAHIRIGDLDLQFFR